MGVYLPNIDMPKGDKVLTVQICPDGSIWQQYRGTVPNAKAVPVPPHGRLGDLDKLADNMRSATAGMEHRAIVMHEIRRAPTIIGTEEGET